MTLRLRRGLAAKLFTAQLLVVAAASVTLAAVAFALAPTLLSQHAAMAPGVLPPDTMRHINEGLARSLLLSLTAATGVGLSAAAGASWLVARRIVDPIRGLAAAAAAIARGGYAARVPPPDSGDELAALGRAFNAMADALETSEARRQRLLTDLAHELRTPLATIEGYLEGLADGIVSTDETSRVLRAQTARLRRLVDDLNTVSRTDELQLDLHPSDCDVGQLVAAAIDAVTPAYATKGVTLTSHREGRLPTLRADPDRIGEILANLLGNALRHTPAGGSVAVSIDARGGTVSLSVADTGVGIPPELLEQIFERFYQVDRSRTHDNGDGSGIGLTITRALVQAHGGRIRAHSHGPGRGARFTVTLPAAGIGG